MSKIRYNIYRSGIQINADLHSDFRPLEVLYSKLYSLGTDPQELWNPPSKAVPGKFPSSGEPSKQNCLQNRANFHRPRVWQIVLASSVKNYLKISNIRCAKSQNLKSFSSRLAVAFAQSIEARCYVENEDVVAVQSAFKIDNTVKLLI